MTIKSTLNMVRDAYKSFNLTFFLASIPYLYAGPHLLGGF